ncbi:hypothetical protein ACEN2I_15480 [Flavobacterium sp. W22_SRS_FK3]|uniref:hypothetical protein n=1 Tax=Flavobacterium sp. W22_SRS_FK3 TaxID=3240275 RepID=UPI003F8FBCB1
MNIPCILIPALVGLISGILGYLIGKMGTKADDSLIASLQSELDACRSNTNNLNVKIASLETDLAEKANISHTTQSFVASTPAFLFDSGLALTGFGKKVKENDLKIVEGIGPKIEALLNASGIYTWKDLSETSTEKVQSILNTAGESYAIHNPSTWPKQALLAHEGKWQELKEWQSGLRGGKE